MKYIAKNYEHLKDIGEISNAAFALHLKLYEGYVNNTNEILEKLPTLAVNSPGWNELNRRFGWEWNGMRSHELFFDSLQAESFSFPLEGKLYDSFSVFFGGYENWKKNFEAICKIRGIGWAMLVQDKRTGQLMNVWVNEHDAGMLSDVNIILNIDMFEHAYIKDFGTDRQKYLDSIFAHINWEIVGSRLA
jgi:Fe-Mn family superoxide dismutase